MRNEMQGEPSAFDGMLSMFTVMSWYVKDVQEAKSSLLIFKDALVGFAALITRAFLTSLLTSSCMWPPSHMHDMGAWQ